MTFDTVNTNVAEIMGQMQSEVGATGIAEMRQEALKIFNKYGFPLAKDEDYKYMNLEAIRSADFRSGCMQSVKELTEQQILEYLVQEAADNILVLVNGIYSNTLSKHRFPKGVIAGSLLDNIDHPSAKKYLGTIEPFTLNGFNAQNTARFSDGLFVYVPRGINVDGTLQILKISDNRESSFTSYNRSLIVVEDGGTLNVVESFYSIGDNPGFNNSLSEICLEPGATIKLTKTQLENNNTYLVDNTGVLQGEKSSARLNTVSLGSSITRNNLNVTLSGEHAITELYGFYVSSLDQQVDNHTIVNHNKANCNSLELYKGIADEDSTSTFNGKIFVEKDAQKTNAFQSNKNILLSDTATINTKPQLEIYADDVKCSHGATIGQMDNEALFYLRSRGISKDQAQLLMIRAFAADVLDKIGISSLEKNLEDRINQKLSTHI